MDDALLWIALRETPGLRRPHAHALLERFGSPVAIFGRPIEELGAHCGSRAAVSLRRGPDLERARRELEAVRSARGRPLTPSNAEFPELLRHIPDPPLLVYLRGTLPDAPVLAMVGSRRATSSGRRVAAMLAREACAARVAVVSGLAYGIDAASHEGALEGGGPSVAVLATGIDRPAPRGNRRLAERILSEGGAWMSEYPPGHRTEPWHFPERNRLISGLARATLIVEARERSGSLWTAKHAIQQDRELRVVPGAIDSDACRGSNALLREGCKPVLGPEDLAELLGLERPAPRAKGRPELSIEHQDPDTRRVLEVLRDGAAETDALARALRLSIPELTAILLELELSGRLVREGSLVALLR